MYVVAEVYETDVGLVKRQPATITSRNGAFTPLNGKVAEIGWQILRTTCWTMTRQPMQMREWWR